MLDIYKIHEFWCWIYRGDGEGVPPLDGATSGAALAYATQASIGQVTEQLLGQLDPASVSGRGRKGAGKAGQRGANDGDSMSLHSQQTTNTQNTQNTCCFPVFFT